MYNEPTYENPRPNKRRPQERTRPSTAGTVAIVVWCFLAALALLIAAASVAAFSGLTKGLENPTKLEDLPVQQESIIYDRTGTIELARVGQTRREIVTFEEIPPIVIDAQTAIEDKTFWENTGFDPLAIVSAGFDSLRGRSRGASTITQQLVRQRLLDPELVQDPERQVERKLKEIIQSIRLTKAYEGVEGKEDIITAYLNQNYYGNQTYGIKAAAKGYFGKELAELTIAEAAILAGLPKSPSNYDLVRNAVVECSEAVDAEGNCPGQTTLVVPESSEIVQRRNLILELLAEGDRNPLSEGEYSRQDFLDAMDEPVIIVQQQTPRWIAPHFVWAVQKEMATQLCGVDVPTCDALEAGGLRVTTTLDVPIQGIAQKWVMAATRVPNARNPEAAAEEVGVPYEDWMRNLRGKDLHNGALVAIDYQTGEVIAYVGSADYYGTNPSPAFQPQYDVAGAGWRQPGSAFKPFNYLVGIDDKTMTASSMFMDSATDFGGGYTPSDADNLERGPVRVRNALQFSLNIPSVKAMAVNGADHVFSRAKDFGMTFQTDTTSAGVALALGVQEVRPVDLTTAYGTIANAGNYIPHTTILAIKDASGTDVVDPYVPPPGTPAASPQAAYIVTDILAGNTNPDVNPYWGEFEITNEAGDRRPATLKTGTNNDAKDLNAYGYIAAPSAEGRAAGEFALSVGAWNGNSDNSLVSTPDEPVFSIEVTTFVWQGFLNETTAKWAINDFAAPDELVRVTVDPWTGARPLPGSRTVEEVFIVGTEPTSAVPAGVCGSAVFEFVGFEKTNERWVRDDNNWFRRARQGPGTAGGVNGTRVSFFYNFRYNPYGKSWGIVEGFGCKGAAPSPTCIPLPTPDENGVVPSFTVPTPDPRRQESRQFLARRPRRGHRSRSRHPSHRLRRSRHRNHRLRRSRHRNHRLRRSRHRNRPRRRPWIRRRSRNPSPDGRGAIGGSVVQVDLNADVGESLGPWPMGDDAALIPLVTSVNVACGAHAGDPLTIERTVRLAASHGVAVGAHPGYPDLVGFGRRDLDMAAEELEASIVYQVAAVAAFAVDAGVPLRHVKPHGALYNKAARDRALADVVVRAVGRVAGSLVLVGLAGSELIAAGRAAGLPTAAEAFADRAYEADGSLRSRRLAGAVHDDPEVVAAQAVAIARDGRVTAHDGSRISVRADTICIHGDSPGATAFARAVREALVAADVTVAALEP